MIVYFLFYILFIFLSLEYKFNNKYLKISIGIILIFLIGFRHEVGADWIDYLGHYNLIKKLNLTEAFLYFNQEPLPILLNWLAGYFNLGVYGINLLYSIVFVIGLFRFASKQQNFWLVIAVSFPYLIMIVSMGYSRQSVAIGLFLLAITFLEERKIYYYSFFVFLAGLFHASAFLLLPLGYIIYGKKNKFVNIVLLLLFLYIAWEVILSSKMDSYMYGYIHKERQSSGGFIRIFMNIFAGLIFLKYRKRWKKYLGSMYKFWLILSIANMFLLLLVFKFSTAADRIALYFIPIQLFIFSNLHYIIKAKKYIFILF